MRNQDANNRGIWARALALLGVLCVLQTALLVKFGDQIVLTHWWMRDSRPSGFWRVVVLLLVTLLVLARAGRGLSPAGVRRAILLFFAAGTLTALLSLEVMERSYLHIWLRGELSLRDISSYLFLDFFDRKPWLGLYPLAFVPVYALAHRWKRDAYSLYALAVIAMAYVGVNHAALARARTVMALLQVLGVCGLGVFLFHKDARHGGISGLFLVLAAMGVLILRPAASCIGGVPGHLVAVAVATCIVHAAAWYGLVAWGFPPRIRALLPFLSATVFFLAGRNYPAGRNINGLLVYGMSLAHYYWAHVLVSGGFLATGLLLKRRAPRLVPLLDAAAVVFLAASIVDYHVTQLMGMRLGWSVLAMSDSATLLFRTIRPYLTWEIFATLAACVGLYAGGSLVLARPRPFGRLRHTAASAGFAYAAALVAATSLFHGRLVKPDQFRGNPVVRIVQTAPAVVRWRQDKLPLDALIRANAELGLPTLLAGRERLAGVGRPGKPLNLVFILLESTANRYLSLFGGPDPTQPLLSAWADRMELFPTVFGTYPTSNHARFSSFNGLYATRTYVTYVNPRIPCPSLFEILHDHGYYNAMFYSSYRHYTRFFDYIGHRDIDLFCDATNMPGAAAADEVAWGVREEATLNAMKSFLARRERQDAPFALAYIPAAPHMPYDIDDERFRVFAEGLGELDGNFTGKFKNNLLYMDWIVAGLIEGLAANGLLDSTLVIITSDHGELLGGAGGRVGHGVSLEPGLANLPLIIMHPRATGLRVNTAPGSHVDLLPTLLDLLALPVPDGELYQGVSLYTPAAARRPIYLVSAVDRAIVEDGRYIRETTRGKAEERVYEVYRIRHDGAATAFEPAGELDAAEGAACKQRLDQFERMQKSLILFYGDYVRERAGSRAHAGR